MKVKGKAKQLFCMVCAFVASFVLTVTAAALTYGTVSPGYKGTYKCSTPSLSKSKIIAYDEETCKIVIYFDNRSEYMGYYSGETDNYVLSPAFSTSFFVMCDKATRVDRNGNQIIQNGEVQTVKQYYTSGKVLGTTITSDDSALKYVKQ